MSIEERSEESKRLVREANTTSFTGQDLMYAYQKISTSGRPVFEVPEVQAALAKAINALVELERMVAVQDAIGRIESYEAAIERARAELDILRGVE